jgi:hypothetical protein
MPENQASSDDCPDGSRRCFMGGISAGLVAGVAGAAASLGVAPNARAAGAAGGQAETRALVDPVDEYPRPPFPHQQQPWPGLAGQMQPRPDHGEHSYRGSGRLAGRHALITGGDSGMGRAAAIAFAREGADVAINYLPQEEPDAREVVHLIRGAGRRAVALPGDLRDEAFCTRLVGDAIAQLGALDVLVSNAARQHAVANITDLSTELFDWTFKTNVYPMFWLIRAAMPHLRPGASIIATSSINAFDPAEDLVDYSATKAAILNMTRSLAKQLAPRGIRINAVAPGPVWTPLQPSGGQPPDKLPDFGGDTPMGRPGQPVELAPIYVLLASAELSYTTGQVYGATGGRSGP